MDKKKKGLAEQGDGDFILNESGTSINVDNVEDVPNERSDDPEERDNKTSAPYMPRIADEQKDTTD